MRVISVKPLREFWEAHPDAQEPKGRRVVFNIKGNDYRLVASVAYKFGALYVKFIGTHAQYDRIDADSVEL